MSAEYLTFSVHGDYITDLIRTVFIESGYQKAYDVYINTFSKDLPVEYLNNILMCKMKFDGINEFEYVEDSWEENKKYKESFDFLFNGVIAYDNNEYYKPYAKIVSWTKPAFIYASHSWKVCDKKNQMFFNPLGRYCDYTEIKSYYYVHNLPGKYDIFILNKDHVYVFKKIDFEIPYFLASNFKKIKHEEALNLFKTSGGYIKIIDPLQDMIENEKLKENRIKDDSNNVIDYLDNDVSENDFVKSNEQFRNNFAKKSVLNNYKERILKQNDNNFIHLNYIFNDENKSIQIPTLPFHQWCIGSGRLTFDDDYEYLAKQISDWKCISPIGLKMMNDNNYHSDWVIGAGLDPEEWYIKVRDEEDEYNAIDDSAWNYAFNFCINLRKRNENNSSS